MSRFKIALARLGRCAMLVSSIATAQSPPATIRHIALLNAGRSPQLEIVLSQPITPQVQLLANPDRLAIDLPGAVVAANLSVPPIHAGQIKAVRVGLFTANPPVTRVVIDLSSPQSFQVLPSGRGVLVSLGGAQRKLAAFKTEFEVINSPPPTLPAPPPQPVLRVDYRSGNLSIVAERVTLAQVLQEIQKKTGAEIAVPPGALEQVVVKLGPGPVRDVLAALLNGSRYNFVMIGSDSDPSQLRSVILTPRGSS